MMESVIRFFVTALITLLGCAITFATYYVFDGFEPPSFEKLTFGIAFFALFTANEAKWRKQ